MLSVQNKKIKCFLCIWRVQKNIYRILGGLHTMQRGMETKIRIEQSFKLCSNTTTSHLHGLIHARNGPLRQVILLCPCPCSLYQGTWFQVVLGMVPWLPNVIWGASRGLL